jgi:hypothetical protein
MFNLFQSLMMTMLLQEDKPCLKKFLTDRRIMTDHQNKLR